ncbi:MAG: tripartite tricarboxylate transporter substrate-binding protein [Xylophilus ampelinus]
MIARRSLLLATGGLACTSLARAQGGRRTPRLLVGFPPGGAPDVLARSLATKLHADASNYVVENKPGAGGRLAVLETKRSEPDGRTVLVTADPILTIYPYVFKNIGYDPLADLVPVAPIAAEPMGLAVGPMVPASVATLADFIAWCRKNPGDASYATAAAGTTMHFLGAMLAQSAKFDFTHIPHRGAAAGVQDVMGGQIASTIVTTSQLIPQMSTGKLRVLAVSSAQRMKRLPDVPTFVELGYKSIDALVYYGAYVRAGTPAAVVQKLAADIQAIGASPEMAQTRERMGVDDLALGQEKFAAYFKSDFERWGPIVKASGYRTEE